MGLKAFHLFFIAISLLFLAPFGFWEINRYGTTNNIGDLALGIFSLAATVLMLVYGKWFLSKLKGIGYL